MQTPAPTQYERATSVDEAIDLLTKVGPTARIIAGGHSLIPMMRLRLAQPECVIDINDLHELSYIREEEGEIRIGALPATSICSDQSCWRIACPCSPMPRR